MKPISIMIAMVVIIVVNCSFRAVSQDTSCIRHLYPCLTILDTSRDPPPNSCCEPLKYVINYLPECLCSMMSTGGSFVAELAGINVTEVQRLPGQCGENVNFLRCLADSSISRTDFSSAARRLFRSAGFLVVISMLIPLHCIL
ncbi:hypothetical protein LIER_12614 [Lithospermum erythrorhizon]|uniref:Bifunctional inhibitor/plant lipid transfer protein/seed storage helical domain-containing protein n=1 Tax=Lithospermum erythrorhizon TaxID=34254 RepID=A0AAV3PUI0_LITER